MAGIIPKPIKKTPRLYELAPYIVFGLAAAAVLAYAILFYLENKASKALLEVEDKIAQVGAGEERAVEAQVLLDKQKIDDFSKLFAGHKRPSNFFQFLEENSHPKAWFNKLELDVQNSQAILSGETADFKTLGQQIVIFQNQELIQSIDVSDMTIGKTGRVNFSFSLSLNPEIFKNDENK